MREGAKIKARDYSMEQSCRTMMDLKDKLEDAKTETKKLQQELNMLKRYLFVKICNIFS